MARAREPQVITASQRLKLDPLVRVLWFNSRRLCFRSARRAFDVQNVKVESRSVLRMSPMQKMAGRTLDVGESPPRLPVLLLFHRVTGLILCERVRFALLFFIFSFEALKCLSSLLQ